MLFLISKHKKEINRVYIRLWKKASIKYKYILRRPFLYTKVNHIPSIIKSNAMSKISSAFSGADPP